MIQPNELRIGNWYINSEGKFERLESIYDIYVNPKIYFHFGEIEGDTFESIKPISLTPEILNKCGFGKSNVNYKEQAFEKVVSKGQLTIYIWLDGAVCLFGEDHHELTYVQGEVQYLHQLQNLYFALTQQELEIKEL